MRWQLRSCTLEFHGLPRIMGILNVTPDSFSDGGRFSLVDAAVTRALEMQAQGADILDLGAESTRPFSEPVSDTEQLRRLQPLLEQLEGQLRIPVSIDTQSAQVAEAVLKYPCVQIINDVSGLSADPRMTEVVAEHRLGVCVMHMQGTPQTMQINPHYEDVVKEIYDELALRYRQCCEAGIEASRICLDPGIGFGKTHAHNLTLLENMRSFLTLPAPILVGHSRKGFIAHIIGDKTVNRDAGTIGVSLAMARAGVHVLRVHDVLGTRHALQLFAAVGGLHP